MLRPPDSATRDRKALDGLWRFARDRRGLEDGHEMAAPASYQDISTERGLRDHIGEVWYETTARVPAGWTTRSPPRASRRGWSGRPRPVRGSAPGTTSTTTRDTTARSGCNCQNVGIRTVVVGGNRFLINGEPFSFTGDRQPKAAAHLLRRRWRKEA